MKNTLLRDAVRHTLYGLLPIVAAPSVFAADQVAAATTSSDASTAQLGKIEVTGTRIKRTDVETAQPVSIVTQSQIKASGLTSIGDVLQQVSSFGAALNTQFNNGGDGETRLNLRNLSSVRLLVLLNGQRVDSGVSGAVDLNDIPSAIIDHVEILQDGASAIYGSDAISGVVNIITVKNYTGAEANAFVGMFDGSSDGGGWDGKIQSYDFTIGSSGDKSGIVMNVAYVNQSPMFAGHRTITKEPLIGGGNSAGSSGAAGGRFDILARGDQTGGALNNTGCSFSSTGTLTFCDLTPSTPGSTSTTNTVADLRRFAPTDRFNYAPLNYLVTPNERASVFVQAHYDLADNLTFSTMAIYNDRTSQQQLAPSPLFLGGGGASFTNGQPISVSRQNPYNPFGIGLIGVSQSQTGHTGGGAPVPLPSCYLADTCYQLAFLGRRPLELGNRVFNEEKQSFAFRGGFKGYFNMLGNEWDWDANYNYGKNYEADVTNGLVNTERLQTALGSSTDNGAGGTVDTAPCTINGIAAPGCTPFNIFGGYNLATGQGSITPDMAKYVLYEDHTVTQEVMRDYTANISGDLFDLPAGPFGLAMGVESLEHDAFTHPDALTQEGNTSGNVTQPANGREATQAEYVEFNIPLVTDAPFMKDVSLDVAERWSQFKWKGGNIGSAIAGIEHSAANASGRAALRWQATDSLLLRGSWSQGFRIPSVSEFFLGNSDTFPGVSDPCAGPAGPKPGTVAGTCSLSKVVQPNGQIRTTIGGNPLLTPERSISRTAGFVYNPASLPGFDFSLDYWKIELLNAVSTIGPQTIMNGCYFGGNLDYCKLITRGAGPSGNYSSGGDASDILNTNVNIGGIKTEGVDLSTHYKFPSGPAGDFKAGMDWTFTKSYVLTTPFAGGALSSQELSGTTSVPGAVGGVTVTSGTPKQRGNINLTWNSGDWSASWAVEYVGHMIEDCNGVFSFFGAKTSLAKHLVATRCTGQPTASQPGSFPFDSSATVPTNHIGATTYHDVAATYHSDGINTDFTFGIRNLFDKQPPIAMSAFANSFLPTFYRAPGRFFYGRIGVKF